MVLSFRPSRLPRPAFAHRRVWLKGLAATALLSPIAVPSFALGNTVDLDWQDSSRDRSVPVRLYLPERRSTERALAPLVVFSHGLGGSRYGYSWLGLHFAANGIASLHVQHIGSDRTVWAERGNPLAMLGRLQDAASEREALARVLDLRFAVDKLADSSFSATIDTRRVVAAGHSYGANTTLLASGARIDRPGQDTRLSDPRIAAAVLISAPPFHGEGSAEKILSPLNLPSLHITATEDTIRLPGYYSTVDDRVALFEATPGPDKTLVVYSGGSHSMFTDRTSPGGESVNLAVKAATRELVLGFIERTLLGTPTRLHGWRDRHAALLARYVEAGQRPA